MANTRGSYRDFTAALNGDAPVTCVYGSNEFLVNEAVRILRERAVKGGAVVAAVEAPALTEAMLASFAGQASLFEPRSHYVIRRCEAARNLAKVMKALKALPPLSAGGNTLCFVLPGESPTAALKGELTRLGARLVPCPELWPNETPVVLNAVAASLGLKLKPDGVQLLVEANGHDLVTQANELRMLAMIYGASGGANGANGAGGAPAALGAAEVAPHLGLLREDDRFALDQLLLKRQWAKAQALVGNLLARGEKGLSLLALLSSHCRNALKVGEALNHGSGGDLAGAARVAPFIAKLYGSSLPRPFGAGPYARALALCHDADVLFKSSRVDEGLVLGRVIEELAGA